MKCTCKYYKFSHCKEQNANERANPKANPNFFQMQAMHAVEPHTFINFLPVILNKLFHLLPYSQLDEVQLNIVRCVWCQPFGVSVSVGVNVQWICVGDGGVIFQ